MKKSLGICAIVAISLLLAGCGKSNIGSSTTATLNECKKNCDVITNDTTKKDDCYNLCETSKKLESNDVSDCENIEETSNNFVTKDVCIQDKAIQSKNPEYCGMLSEETTKDTCYAGLASEMKDQGICENIKNETIKSICLSGDTEETSDAETGNVETEE